MILEGKDDFACTLQNAKFTAHKIALLLLMLTLIFSGRKIMAQALNPVTTLWHNFGGQMLKTMDSLVDEFNKTVGRENGITLNVTSITDSATIKEKLAMIAADDPGAPEMPDIATCYPQTAILLESKGLLARIDDYFTQKELDAYLPGFLNEGYISDHLRLSFAKSTEVLFVSKLCSMNSRKLPVSRWSSLLLLKELPMQPGCTTSGLMKRLLILQGMARVL